MKQLGMVLAHGGPFFKRIDNFGLKRAEFIIIAHEHMKSLQKFIDSHLDAFSAHCPIEFPENYPENPLLASIIDFDEDRRLMGVSMMEKTIRIAADLGAEYVVAHLQRPEHFAGGNPPGATTQDALDVAFRSCEHLAKVSEEVNMPVLIENLMDNSLFNRPESHIELLEKFPSMNFCLDLGHLDVDARKFGFLFDDFVDALLPWIKAIHLHNSNTGLLDMKSRHWKIPVNPSQAEEANWLDIEVILRRILAFNPDCVINFEARLDELHGFDYMTQGISWIQGLLPGILSELKNGKV